MIHAKGKESKFITDILLLYRSFYFLLPSREKKNFQHFTKTKKKIVDKKFWNYTCLPKVPINVSEISKSA